MDIEDFHAETDNELRLKHRVYPENSPSAHLITIQLVFQPNSRRLAEAKVFGVEELGIDLEDVLSAHLESNDVHGLVGAVLSRTRRCRLV